ncbi:hypothetical protein IWW48_002173 [Coemansia sp. RSA 1200]|nr:hypothetical protein IWW48_002173 [Coemansia sp. RSA 1200]
MSSTAEATPRNSSSAENEMQNLKIRPDDANSTEDVQVDSEQSKFSAILGILRKVVGVADVINLIPESDDEVERMLATLAWWFSKLLKHKGKIHKPFNSILGEQFFCRWDVGAGSPGTSSTERESTVASSITDVSAGSDSLPVHVEYITEQVSHHPPVSAFLYRCPQKGVEAAGLDHICAKFTGLSATVATGSESKGIFVTLKSRDNETYHTTHPVGNIVGWLRGNLKVQFAECSYIVCQKSRLAAVIEFKEERWFGKSKENVVGKVFKYDPQVFDKDTIMTWRLKDIPKSCSVVATFEGCWDKKVTVQRMNGNKKLGEAQTLLDMSDLDIAAKIVKPLEEQSDLESRRIWEPVATMMLQGKYGDATKLKRGIEERQRVLASERKEKSTAFVPALFKADYSGGKPELLDAAVINI